MASIPYTTTDTVTTVLAPGAVVGQTQNDVITFFGGGVQLASVMVENQYYTVDVVGGVNFGTYGALQAAPNGNGVANTVGSVYFVTGPATLIAGSTGASASFANNSQGIGVMTLTVAATGGTVYPIVGQVVTGTGLPLTGLIVQSILTGANNAVGSTYLLSGSTGTVAAEAITLYQASYVTPLPIALTSPILSNPAFGPLVTSAATTGGFGFLTAAEFTAAQAQLQALTAAFLALGVIT